jgi:hypothetical protein
LNDQTSFFNFNERQTLDRKNKIINEVRKINRQYAEHNLPVVMQDSNPEEYNASDTMIQLCDYLNKTNLLEKA